MAEATKTRSQLTVAGIKLYAAVGVGGALGALLREAVEQLIPVTLGFPFATLFINWSGSLLLAWFYTISIRKWRLPVWLRTGVGTGIVGAYTTFSTFSVETDKLLGSGRVGEAILYVALSLFGGFALALLGVRLGGEKPERQVQGAER